MHIEVAVEGHVISVVLVVFHQEVGILPTKVNITYSLSVLYIYHLKL